MLRRMTYSRSPISRLSPFIYTVPSDTKYLEKSRKYQLNKHNAHNNQKIETGKKKKGRGKET